MKKIISLFVAAVLMCTAMVGCSKSESVSTDGSTSMSKVIESLSEAFLEDTGIEVTYNLRVLVLVLKQFSQVAVILDFPVVI